MRCDPSVCLGPIAAGAYLEAAAAAPAPAPPPSCAGPVAKVIVRSTSLGSGGSACLCRG